VFDAAMLVGLAEYEKEALLASLLIFRVLYFVLPFMLALSLLGVRELVLGARAAGGGDGPRRGRS
jgi:glycosyltransferase 2 family protein